MGCDACGTHTGTHWPDCPHGSEPHASRDALRKEKEVSVVAIGALRSIAEGEGGREDAEAALRAIKKIRS